MVAGLDVGDALADGLDDTGTLVSKDDGESTLGVLSRECVRIYPADQLTSSGFVRVWELESRRGSSRT